MKKIVLSLIAITAFAFASKAQDFGFQKNDVILEGSVGVNFTEHKSSQTKNTSLSIYPSVGYFVTDKFAVGIQPEYALSKQTSTSGSQEAYTKTNALGISVFGRYYFLEAGTRFKFYSQLDLGYSRIGGEQSNGITTFKLDKTNSIGINGSVGTNYFVTKNIAIGYQFSNIIGFSTSKVDADGAKASNNFYANLNSFDNFFSSGQFSLTFKL